MHVPQFLLSSGISYQVNKLSSLRLVYQYTVQTRKVYHYIIQYSAVVKYAIPKCCNVSLLYVGSVRISHTSKYQFSPMNDPCVMFVNMKLSMDGDQKTCKVKWSTRLITDFHLANFRWDSVKSCSLAWTLSSLLDWLHNFVSLTILTYQRHLMHAVNYSRQEFVSV